MITKKIFDIFSGKRKYLDKKPSRKIVADYRERNSLVPAELVGKGVEIEFRELKVGDYLVGKTIIERKTFSDFISSMINKRLLNQIEQLKQHEDKLLIIEASEEKELYDDDNAGGINPNAIRGFLLSIILKHKIPIIFTKSPGDTAKYLLVLLNKKETSISLNPARKSRDKKEQIRFIVESFPGIGMKTAEKLLLEFKTVKNIINASEEDLKKVIGKKAEVIISLINGAYS